MNKYNRDELPKEAQELYDSCYSTVIMVRMYYAAAIKEGFTPSQALQVALESHSAMLHLSFLMGGVRK